ncbi:AN1-type zinc finger protein 2A isoform X2 [Amia ocellicauda]|uniref:AN1-type zinc finger protein 2A isoform X2 n=1 Tax=Amia ocellicauda TaxID=2972642 RepID=UPI0034638DF8
MIAGGRAVVIVLTAAAAEQHHRPTPPSSAPGAGRTSSASSRSPFPAQLTSARLCGAMEFPDLGAHCSERTCKRLDFLPMKCDACQDIFCKDHITYVNHRCTSAYKKDVQVPVCPLCNTPIPVKRGEMPDIKVGEHIDRDCKSDPAQRKRKIFTNKCSKGGCKQKEMIKVTCDQCHLNYCLKHRHPLDHECKTEGGPLSKAGHAALMRTRGSGSSSGSSSSGAKGASRSVPNGLSGTRAQQSSSTRSAAAAAPAPPPAPRPVPQAASLQAGLSEEQALQRALEMSLAESARSTQEALSPQEQEDLALAQALAASEEEFQRQQQLRQVSRTITSP